MHNLHYHDLPKYIAATLMFCMLGAGIASAATITKRSGVCCSFMFKGMITPADVTTIRTILSNFPDRKLLLFNLQSQGGDVHSAIQIGYIFRKSRAIASILSGDECLSSCVFLLAGATQRGLADSAKVGIHRPYSLSTESLDYAQAQRNYRELDNEVRKFLSEMNLPTQLYDAMQRVPSEEIKILTREELRAFGLDQTDPVSAELQNSRAARKYGLTKQEYIRRATRANYLWDNNLCSKSDPRIRYLNARRFASGEIVTNEATIDSLIRNWCKDQVMRGLR